MTKLLVTACTFLLGSLGWYAGELVGTFTAFTLSVVGSGLGVYLGRQLGNRWGV